MIRAPWWAFALAFGAGLAVALLWPTGSDSATDELRAQRDSARARVEIAAARTDSAIAVADSATEAHAALAASTDSTIARLTQRIQATTARAADVADQIRARVDRETAGLLTELEDAHAATLAAERAQTATWEARALSAEAGWADERLARVAAEDQVEAMAAAYDSQAALVRALEAETSRLKRDLWISRLAGAGGVVWGMTR